MGTAAKTNTSSHPIEEFLGYDSKGQGVVLRRSTLHPGVEEKPAPAFHQKAASLPERQPSASVKGSFGFFADLPAVRARLLGKLQHS